MPWPPDASAQGSTACRNALHCHIRLSLKHSAESKSFQSLYSGGTAPFLPCSHVCQHELDLMDISHRLLALVRHNAPSMAEHACSSLRPGWGSVCSIACWAPLFPMMPEHNILFGSGVPHDSPLEGHLLWDLASITHGSARS